MGAGPVKDPEVRSVQIFAVQLGHPMLGAWSVSGVRAENIGRVVDLWALEGRLRADPTCRELQILLRWIGDELV